jgi:hypothetical protein
MRITVVSAAIMFAAASPFGSSSGDNGCASCATAVQISAPTTAPANQDASAAKSDAGANAQSAEPAAASEAAVRPDVCATLIAAAQDNELPPAFLARLIWQESRFDPQSVSRAGALGIAQFMPQTASEVGLGNPYDPIEALPASARLLSHLHREFGNLGLAAAAYNAGRGRIRDWLSSRQSLPQETKNYVQIITGNSAKDWTDERSWLELPTALPTGTPCREINAADGGAAVPVKVQLSAEITNLIQKGKAELEAAAARARRSVKLHRARRGRDTMIALHHHGHRHKALAARGSRRARLADV